MNIFSIESKFQQLDKKDKHTRQYYNPKSNNANKHQYISDIRADFHYDTLLYGLGLFWNEEIENDLSIVEEKIVEPSFQEVSKSKVNIKGNENKIDVIAKRKNQKVLEIQKPLTKDNYQGIFSNTKVLNHDYLYKKPELEKRLPG